MFKLKFGFILLFGLAAANARAKIDFNKNCNQAFEDIFSLKLPKANEVLSNELEKNPQNALAYYLKGLSEIIFVFIDEDEKSYKKLQSSIPLKIKNIEKYGGKSAYTQFFKGQLLFYFGITQSKFDNFIQAGSNIRDSYIILKNNSIKYPAFLPNNTIMGVIETFSGTIPSSFKWIINMFGVKASVNNGMKRLVKISESSITKGSELNCIQFGTSNIIILSKQLIDDYIGNDVVTTIRDLQLDFIIFDENQVPKPIDQYDQLNW